MMAYFLILGFFVILVQVVYGELALATPDMKRLPGFARFYLGRPAEKLAAFTFVAGSFGSLLAYLIVGGEFLGNLLSPYFGGSVIIWTLIYLILGAGSIYIGINWIKRIEFWGVLSFFVILFILFFRSQPFLKAENFSSAFDPNYIFLPYGPILFSLWGASLIPEIEEMMGRKKNLLKTVIISSVLISIIFYILFVYLVLGVTGSQTTESALVGLKNFLGDGIANLGFLFGVIATFTSFITVGLTLRNLVHYDLKIKKNYASLITFLVPLALFFMGLQKFIPIISFIGAAMLGIEGALILLMYKKMKKSNGGIIVLSLIFIFIFGIIYELVNLIK